MTPTPPSDLRRDLKLLDAAFMATLERILGGGVPADPGERVLCRLDAERLLALAETVQGLLSRPDPAPADEAGPAPCDGRPALRAVA